MSRPLDRHDSDIVFHEAASVTRPAVILEAGASHRELGDLAPGTLDLWLAPRPSAEPGTETHNPKDTPTGSVVTVELRGRTLLGLGPSRDVGSCRVQIDPDERLRMPWHHCRLHVHKPISKASLHIEADARVALAATLRSSKRRSAALPVFMFMMDTARADRLKPFNPDAPVGNSLELLARDSVVFSNVRAPSSWTRSSVATLLTGEPPRAHGVASRMDMLGDHLPLLHEELAAKGWRTMAWSANPNVLARWGFARGFDYFVDTGALDWLEDKTDARDLLSRVRRTVGEQRHEATFYYVHLMDPHSPYQPDEASLAALDRVSGVRHTMPAAETSRRERLIWFQYRRYLAEMLQMDHELGRFMTFLQDQGLYDESMIVVVSDHGEEFLDHGGMFHGRTLYEEVLRVPLMIKFPQNHHAGKRVSVPLGLEHVASIVLRGLEPPRARDKQDLVLPWVFARTPQVAELDLDGHRRASIVEEGLKLVVDYNDGGQQLFDLSEDPLERRDLADSRSKDVQVLATKLGRLTARERPGWYVAGCSSGEPVDVVLRVEGFREVPTGVWLEEDDRVEINADGSALAWLHLRPGKIERAHLGRMEQVDTSDRDGLYLGESIPAELAVTPRDGAAMEFAAGTAPVEKATVRLVPGRMGASARVGPGEPVRCEIDGHVPGSPYLRVWQRVAAHGDSPIDSALAERLRRLGYAW